MNVAILFGTHPARDKYSQAIVSAKESIRRTRDLLTSTDESNLHLIVAGQDTRGLRFDIVIFDDSCRHREITHSDWFSEITQRRMTP